MIHKQNLKSGTRVIPWMIVLAVIPMLVICYLTYRIAYNMFEFEIKRNVSILLEKKVETIDNYIAERKVDAIQLSKLPSLHAAITQSIQAETPGSSFQPIIPYLQHFTQVAGFDNLVIIDRNSKVLFNMGNPKQEGQVIQPGEPESAQLYQAFTGANTLMSPYISTDTHNQQWQKPKIYVSTPIFINKKIEATLLLKIDIQAVRNVIAQLVGIVPNITMLGNLSDNHVQVIMETGSLILAENGKTLNTHAMALLRRAIQGGSGLSIFRQSRHPTFLFAYRYISQLDMGVISQYPVEALYYRAYWVRNRIIILISVSFILVLAIVLWISSRLRLAHAQTEELLENILPQNVIQELTQKGSYKSRYLDKVSIIFADMVNFTHYASETPPDLLTKFLSDIFTEFDKLADKYHIEKIKTIGDAYMAVAGLTKTTLNQANQAVDFGLEMIKAMRIYNINHHTNFKVRVGIHTGPVTAGIISAKKFSYDLWGNDVNLSARMESTGKPDHIQISEATYQQLQDKEQYEISGPATVTVKGIGKVQTYLVKSKAEP